MKKILVFFIICSLPIAKGCRWAVFSQIIVSRYDSSLITEAADTLQNAWAGGINSAMFSQIDLNLDGYKDIFFFEKDGNLIRTFLNNGNTYHFTPEYPSKFPAMSLFTLLADYNCDGKEDIFTYAPGGMAVYKNVSSQLAGLDFTLVTSLLKSNYNPNYVNLYVSSTDVPALADIDNDGDMDILTFGVGGTTVEYHRNFSMELFSTCDSFGFPFSYQLTDACWGKFFESSTSNSVTFPYQCKGAVGSPDAQAHSGSTLLAINTDGDSDKDLLLGDVSFKNMLKLRNGGDSISAQIVSQDVAFPPNSVPVNILFPASYYLDVDNDSVKDLLVAPNTPIASENFTSVWFYKNSGTDNFPVFNFQKNNFLQDEMIDFGSGCNPAFFDYDSDGLMDLVVGNYGYYNDSTGLYDGKLALFRNNGTQANPSYELLTRNYANVSSLLLNALYPAFGDIDSDGDADMILGEYTGTLFLFENTAGADSAANFILKESFYKNIDIGNFAAPQLIDVNRDGLLDLLVGTKSGTISYFQNTGTATDADFSDIPANDFFGGIDVMLPCCTGYATPFLFEDAQGNYSLFVGSEKGTIYYYTDIDSNLNDNFTLTDSILSGEFRASISPADINADGTMEIAVGSYTGGMHILKSSISIIGSNNVSENTFSINIFPNPNDGKFNLQMNQLANLQIEIYNVLGEKIYSATSTSVDLSTKPAGIYFLKLSADEKIHHGKIAKQ